MQVFTVVGMQCTITRTPFHCDAERDETRRRDGTAQSWTSPALAPTSSLRATPQLRRPRGTSLHHHQRTSYPGIARRTSRDHHSTPLRSLIPQHLTHLDRSHRVLRLPSATQEVQLDRVRLIAACNASLDHVRPDLPSRLLPPDPPLRPQSAQHVHDQALAPRLDF